MLVFLRLVVETWKHNPATLVFVPPPHDTDIFAGEPPPQPVALALAQVVANQEGGLTRRWFDRVLDARMADLERTQPATIEEMET